MMVEDDAATAHADFRSLWPRRGADKVSLVASVLELARASIGAANGLGELSSHAVVLAQAAHIVQDFRSFGVDESADGPRPRVDTAGFGLWDRCFAVFMEGGVPPALAADFFLAEAEDLSLIHI